MPGTTAIRCPDRDWLHCALSCPGNTGYYETASAPFTLVTVKHKIQIGIRSERPSGTYPNMLLTCQCCRVTCLVRVTFAQFYQTPLTWNTATFPKNIQVKQEIDTTGFSFEAMLTMNTAKVKKSKKIKSSTVNEHDESVLEFEVSE